MSRSTPARFGRLAIAALLAIAWSDCFLLLHTPAYAAVVQTDPAPVPSEEAIVAALQRMVAIAEKELRAPGADPTDVPAKAASFAYDAARCFEFVRDQIAFEPYVGNLRSPREVLSGSSANALDRSLLLRDLLLAGGHDARIVSGQLSAEDAGRLAQGFLSREGLPAALAGFVESGPDPSLESDALKALAGEMGIASEEITTLLESQADQARLLLEETRALAARHAEPLLEAIQEKGIELGTNHDQWLAMLADRCQAHYWVETLQPDGTWRALDTAFNDASEGDVLGQEGSPLDEVPVEDTHRLDFKVLYHREAGGAVEEVVLVEAPILAPDSLFESPAFLILPADPLPTPSQLVAMTEAERITTLASLKTFQPQLQIGGRRYPGKAFDLEGGVHEVTNGQLQIAEKLGGAMGGLFGGLDGGEDPAQSSTRFVDLQVVMTLIRPGDERHVQTRTLLTAEEVQGEHVMSPILQWQVLVQTHPISAAAVAHRSMSQTVSVLRPLLGMLSRPDLEIDALDDISAHAAAAKPYPSMLVELGMMRQAAMAAGLVETPESRLLWDVPNVTIAEQRFCMNPSQGKGCGQTNIDIVDNGVKFVPGNASAGDIAAEATLRQGLFDTAAELKLVQAAIPEAKTYSPLDDFEQALQDDVKMMAVSVANVTDAASIKETDRQWIQAHEPAGQLIIAPAKEVADGKGGWWSLDPSTGQVLGRANGGRGQEMSEYSIITNLVGFGFCMFNASWDAIKGETGTKAGVKAGLALSACVIGLGLGFAPGFIKAAVTAEKIGLAWAVLNGLIGVADKVLG